MAKASLSIMKATFGSKKVWDTQISEDQGGPGPGKPREGEGGPECPREAVEVRGGSARHKQGLRPFVLIVCF